MAVGVSLASLLTIPYLPSFLYGSTEVTALIVGRGPEVPRTEIGQWYLEYQRSQDAALAKLSAISDPIPLTKVGEPALFTNPEERLALHQDLGEYIGALHAWEREGQADLDRSLAKLDQLHLPPGAAPRVRQVIGTLEAQRLDRQSGWVNAEVGWTTRVIDLYDWMEQADRRGALRLSTKEISWVDGRDQFAYQDRLMNVYHSEWAAEAARAELNDWTAAQNPQGLWQIFRNWYNGYGLTPPPAPEPVQKIA
jgi:hypothetical protein